MSVTASVLVLGGAGQASGSADGSASWRPRVAIVFAPGPAPKRKPTMIERLAAHRELALGFVSAAQGAYSADQTLLDASAGSRTWTSLYDGELPERIELVLSGSGRGGALAGWKTVRERARTPPADVVPGSLAESVRRGAGAVAYVGLKRRRNREAIVAADRNGRVAAAFLESPGALGATAARRWRQTGLLVVRLPAGRHGSAALAALLRARRRQDLLLVIQQPPPAARRLLAAGAIGIGGGSALWSRSTRTEGLVVATDVAPTVLEHLSLPVPNQMTGQPIEARGDRTAGDLRELKDRLAVIGPRRWQVVLGGLAAGLLLAAAAGAFATGGRLRRTARLSFLAALWLPSVLLVSGALAPSVAVEMAFVGTCCASLALATDRLVPRPLAIALPASVAVLVHLVDLALGSDLITRSLLGPNPILGARFYGVGNELEVTLAVIGLVGIGAALAGASPRRMAWGFVAGGGTLAFLLSWGKLGADVGASLMLAAGTAVAVVVALGRQRSRGHLLAIVAAPAVALAALAIVDLATGGDAHFTRSVLRAGGLDAVADVAQRRLELSYRSFRRGLMSLLVAVALLALLWGVRSRRRLLSGLASAPGLRAALFGALTAVVVGTLSNDSGPIILLIGTCYLALCVGYFWGASNPADTPLQAPGSLDRR